MPEVKRKELKVRSKDTFTAVQWFKLGDHPAVTTIPPGTSSYAIPHGSDVTEIGWLGNPTNPGIGYSVSPGEYIIGPMEGDDGEDYYEVHSPETFHELYEEVHAAAEKAPPTPPAAEQPKAIHKKGDRMK